MRKVDKQYSGALTYRHTDIQTYRQTDRQTDTDEIKTLRRILHQMIQLPNHSRQNGRISHTGKSRGKSNFIS